MGHITHFAKGYDFPRSSPPTDAVSVNVDASYPALSGKAKCVGPVVMPVGFVVMGRALLADSAIKHQFPI